MESNQEESPLLGESDAVEMEQANLSSIATRESPAPFVYEDAAPPREAGTLERHGKRASYKENAFWEKNSVHPVPFIDKKYYVTRSDIRSYQEVKACPGWIDAGTRGCPIPNGVVLAGAHHKDSAGQLVIMELRYDDKPITLKLPYPAHSLALAYDDHGGILTIAGGVGFVDDGENDPSTQVWQLELFAKNSKWQQMPRLTEGVYEPVFTQFETIRKQEDYEIKSRTQPSRANMGQFAL